MYAVTDKTAAEPEGAEPFDYEKFDREYPRYFVYDDMPAYRDDTGFVIVTFGGKERPVDDLSKWVDKAMPISKDEFEALKAEMLAHKRPTT